MHEMETKCMLLKLLIRRDCGENLLQLFFLFIHHKSKFV